MTNLEMIRRIATALPEVEEKSHFGRPGFRVSDKLFASVHNDGDRGSIIVNVDRSVADTVMRDFPVGVEAVWRTHGKNRIFVGLRVYLDEASKEQCRELIELAWRNKAPKRLVADHDDR
jgi:hypothetical protein